MKKITTLLMTLFTSVCLSQPYFEFMKKYDNGFGNDLVQTLDNGLVLVGKNNQNIHLIKINYDGDTLWTSNFGESNREEWTSTITNNIDSGFVVSGIIHNPFELFIAGVDKNGQQEWIKTYDLGFYSPTDLIQTSDSNFIATTYNRVLYFNKTGDTLWTRSFGTTFPSYENSIIETESKNFNIVCSDFSVLTIDKNGNQIDRKRYNISGECKAWTSLNEAYYLMGNTGSQIKLTKLNASLDSIWTQTFTEPNHAYYSPASISTCGDKLMLFTASYGDLNLHVYSTDGVSLSSDLIGEINGESGSLRATNINSSVFTVATSSDIKMSVFKLDCSLITDVVSPQPLIEAVFPNPTTGRFSIKTSAEILSVTIFDLQGRERLIAINGNEVDLSSYEAGKYIFKCTTAERTYNQIVIKE